MFLKKRSNYFFLTKQIWLFLKPKGGCVIIPLLVFVILLEKCLAIHYNIIIGGYAIYVMEHWRRNKEKR